MERPRRVVASQKDEKMASKTTISNEDLIALTAKFLRGDVGAQSLSRSHLGLMHQITKFVSLNVKLSTEQSSFGKAKLMILWSTSWMRKKPRKNWKNLAEQYSNTIIRRQKFV